MSWPRLMGLKTAAAYLDVSPNHFKKHCGVEPIPYGGRLLYDRKKLDEDIDRLSTGGSDSWIEECGSG